MNKRIAAAALWFVTGWYAGAFLALSLGVSDAIGPILGLGAALFFAGDPFRVVWKPASREQAVANASTFGASTAAIDL